MNYRDISIPSHSGQPSLGKMVQGTYCITQAEILKIHKFFDILYTERTNRNNVSLIDNYDSMSVSDTRKKSDTKYEDMLILEKSRLQEKWETMRQKNMIEEVSGCTFQPKIKRGPRTISSNSDLNDSTASQYSLYSETKSQAQKRNDILYEYSKIFNQHKHSQSRNQIDFDSAHEIKSCTFRPKISKRIKVEDVPEAKGVKQLINRLRNARKNKVGASTEKPFIFGMENNSSRLSIDLNSSISSTSSKKSMLDKSYVSETESLSIKISLPNGKQTFFKLSPGENKFLAINKFIEKHDLKGEAETKLRNYLKRIIF